MVRSGQQRDGYASVAHGNYDETRDKAILYWFGPPESKTIHPVLQFVLLAWRNYMATCPRRTPLPALYWATDKVGGPESKSVTTEKPISGLFTSWKAYSRCLNLSGVPCLARQATFSSSDPHVRSDRPIDRSAGLLVGRTHLSRTAVNLVGRDPGVPMSHNNPRQICYTPKILHR
jgi:hypothetical protein